MQYYNCMLAQVCAVNVETAGLFIQMIKLNVLLPVPMTKYHVGSYYSLPVQLFLLHFRKYQVFLVFWYILFRGI